MLGKSACLYELGEVLGQGSYGVVYKASRDGLPLAAKKFKDKQNIAEDFRTTAHGVRNRS